MTDPARLLMIDLSGFELSPDERAFVAERPVGGVCVFGRNVRDRFQLAELAAELRELCGAELLLGIDQEGGGVLRLPDVPYPPSAMALGVADDPALTRRVAAATARGLRAAGVNVDFAPVADVNSDPRNPVIADRAFGEEPEHVARHVAAFVAGLQEEGVAATLKHFPGHGDTTTDSHLELPLVAKRTAELEAVELVPFRAGLEAGAAAVMGGHLLLPALDAETPASLSPALIDGLLRERLGFHGAVFTDALNMRAISERYGPGEAAERALAAGVDMPLLVGSVREHAGACAHLDAALAAGRLTPARLARAEARLQALARRFPPRPDPDAAWRDGDRELLDEAARRGLLRCGELPRLAPGERLWLVAAEEVRASAAAQSTLRPADALARELRARGIEVVRLAYDAAAPEAAEAALVEALGAGPGDRNEVVAFASTSRTTLGAGEEALAETAARQARASHRAFVHLALWNPFLVARLPGPALATFGFRAASARAAAAALLGDEAGVAAGAAPLTLAPRRTDRPEGSGTDGE